MAGGDATPARRLLERGDELASLREHLDSVAAGHGRVVVIEGPAGIGKSALLHVTLAAARRREMHTLAARGSEFEHGVAFGIVRQLFEPLLLRATPEEEAALLSGPAGPSEAILSSPDVPEPSPTPTDAEYRALHVLTWLAINASERGPLVLGVDDAQWADRASLRFLAFLERRIEGVPILVVATVRSGEPDTDDEDVQALLVGQRTRVLHPTALSLEATTELVEAGLHQPPDPAFAAACLRATNGNPYYLHELIAALRQARVTPDAAAVDDVLTFDSPAVARMVMHRLARLPAHCGKVAKTAAVLGPLADRDRLGALTGLSPPEVGVALNQLAAADLVAPGNPVMFTHPLVRTAIHSEIPPEERMRLADSTARDLAATGCIEQAAMYLLDVAPGEDPWVLDTLVEAARRATARGAPDIAVKLLARALREKPSAKRRVDLLRRLAIAEAQLAAPEALDTLAEAQRETTDPREAAELAGEAASVWLSYGRPDRAAQTLDEASQALGPEDTEQCDKLDLQRVALAGAFPMLRVPDAVLARAKARAASDPMVECVLHSYLGFDSMAHGRPASEVLEHAERSLRSGVLTTPGTGLWNPRLRALMMLGFSGQPERARRLFDDAVEHARRHGAVLEQHSALGLRGSMSFLLGDLGAAETDARESLNLIPDDAPLAPTFLPLLVDVLIESGRVDEAIDRFAQAGMMDELPVSLVRTGLQAARGRARIASGDLEGGRADVLEAGALQDSAGFTNPALNSWLAFAALASIELGEHERARELSAENLKRAERFGAPLTHGRALRIRGMALGGDSGLEHLRAAVDVLDPSFARLELAHARTALGIALHDAGDDPGARKELRAAIELAQQCGGKTVADRALEALVKAGGRPRRGAAVGLDALTPSERRVVEAVASGMTNRAAAEALFITEKTVEGHLASAYRKLGVSSRAQLPDVLAGRA